MTERLNRRTFLLRTLAGGAALFGLPLLEACGGQTQPQPAGRSEAPAAQPAPTAPAKQPTGAPIRIGMATSLSGPYAALGTDVQHAFELRLRELNRSVLGRPIELVTEDTEGKPDVALRKVEKLVTKDGCKFIVGIIASNEALAIADKMPQWDAIYVSTVPKTVKLTGEACNRHVFRINPSDAFDANAVKLFLDANPDLKKAKWGILAADYEFGRSSAASFKKETGVNVVAEEYAALGAKDFSTFINRFRATRPDAVYVVNAGQDQINFIKQAAGFGITKEIKFIWGTTILESALKALGEAALGLMFATSYTWTIDTPENKAFVEAFKQVSGGELPSMYAGDAYLTARFLLDGISKAGTTETAKVIAALEDTTLDAPIKVAMRKGDHQAVRDHYIAVAERHPGSPYGVALKIVYTATADKVVPPLGQTGCRMA